MVMFRPMSDDPTVAPVATNKVIPRFTVERDHVEAQRLITAIVIRIRANF
jgi:hypothetical protein